MIPAFEFETVGALRRGRFTGIFYPASATSERIFLILPV